MLNASIANKRDAVVKFFVERQGIDAFPINEAADKFGMKLLQWENTDKIYKVKPTDDLSHSLKYTKSDLDGVDAVLFICERFVWRETYAVKREELEKHFDKDGNGQISISNIACSSYFFYNMCKATQWLY